MIDLHYLALLPIFLSGCASSALSEGLDRSPVTISDLDEIVQFPADWTGVLVDAIRKFESEGFSLKCHSVSLQSTHTLGEESFLDDHGKWVKAETEYYVTFYPIKTPDVKIAESKNLFGITPQQRECGLGITYTYNSYGKFLRKGFERHQISETELRD
jgi:hypothetical protein